MRILYAGFAGFLAFQISAWAALRAPDFTVQAISRSGGGTELVAHPPKGHHFNVEAPMRAELSRPGSAGSSVLKPFRATGPEVIFRIPPAESPGSASVVLYVCDDANTFCEKHEVGVSWKGSPGQKENTEAGASPGGASQAASGATGEGHGALDSHGFIDNDPQAAFSTARRKQLPLLIDFYGIWCPPCNELADKVFASGEFGKQAGSFVKLRLDVDHPRSEQWLLRYRIGGFPTVVFASPDGDEISRVVGFRPRAEFLSELRKAWAGRGRPLARLKKLADAGDRAAADRVGLLSYEREEYGQAIHYLKDTKAQREALLASEAGLLKERVDAGEAAARGPWIDALEKAVAELPSSPDSITWRDSLADYYDGQKQGVKSGALRGALVATAQKLIAHPSLLTGYDWTVADLWVEIAEAQDSLGKRDEAGDAWNHAAEEYRKNIRSGSRRGASLELAYCLRKLGKVDEAEKLYRGMETRYPREFTYYFADARMNLKLKRYERARDLAKKAFERSYGTNRLDSAQVLASAYKKTKEPALAKKVIREALDSVPPLPPPGAGEAGDAIQNRFRARVAALKQLDQSL